MSEKELSNEELEKAAGGLKFQSAKEEEINLKTGKTNNPSQGGNKGGKVRQAPDPQEGGQIRPV